MKRLIIFLILFCVSCEKKENCYECSNVCYECIGLANSPLCSSDFVNIENFNNTIDFLASEGVNCTKIDPTISFEECEIEKVKIFESDEYKCIEK